MSNLNNKSLLTKVGRIGIITLDRPPANCYEINFLNQLSADIDTASNDREIKVIILKSASEKFFSAGADIKIFGTNGTPANKKMVLAARSVCEKINCSNKIFIAQINGHTLGGGLELAMACDIRFAAEGNYFLGLPEVKLGLIPGNGGMVRLVKLLGASKALELMVTGENLQPNRAHELGLVNKLLPKSSIDQETINYANKLAEGPARAMACIKQYVNFSSGMDLREALNFEEKLVNPLYDSEDAKEGYAAFIEKRAAKFE